MMIFSGDADLVINNFNGVANKYYLSNKIFYSVHLDNVDTEKSLKFSVKAYENSFYMIQYQFASSENIDDTNIIESGVNYIVSKNYIVSDDVDVPIKHINLKIINLKLEHLIWLHFILQIVK